MLGIRAAEIAIVHIEDALVGDPSKDVVRIPPLAVENRVVRCRSRMLEQTIQ